MKRNHILPLLFLSVTLFPLSSGASVPSDASGDGYEGVASSMSPANTEYACKEGEPIDISFMGLRLSADAGSLIHDMTLQAEALPIQCGHPMPSSMKNVSANGDGVRLLPNGVHFAEEHPAHIILAYDPQRLPIGHSADEIYTFCCEERGGQWHKLERVAIDTIAHTVTSITTHFTDFANAIISLPELPESSAYVPTTLTDMPDPDPLQGIPMVQVNGMNSFGSPTGDNSGSASLTYPIEIPAGRHGLQPDINLYYNSSNGNGPLGVGWSIPTPAVTIDTRWGVPRYDGAYETEAYLVNGEQIVRHDSDDVAIPLPYQDSCFHKRHYQTERFWFRDTRNATRVIRHGQYPQSYWWEVTTTTGVTFYYGRAFDPTDIQHDAIDENSVLRTADGYIGYWALTAVVDLFGNYVLYENVKSGTEGKNVYPQYVYYTGNYQTGTAPTYKIDLTWQNRDDAFSDGRLGLLRQTDKLLCHIGIMYKDTTISAYYMNYECNTASLWKSRLISVEKSDEPNTLRDCDFLEYNLSNYTKYAGSRTTFAYKNAPQTMFKTDPDNLGSNVKINTSASGNWNIGGTVSVGLGANVALSSLSGGGHYNFSMNYAKLTGMLLDLNGDGLPDYVYQDGNDVKYRPQKRNATGFDNEVLVQGLPRLSRDVNHTHNWGLQLSFGIHLNYSNPISFSYTDYFFSDINADGLPDMVTPDGILFNHLINGHPSFSPYTGNSSVNQHNSACQNKGIHYTGIVDDRLECHVTETAVDSFFLGDFNDGGWTEPNDFHGDYWAEPSQRQAISWNPLPTGNGEHTELQDSNTESIENISSDYADAYTKENSSNSSSRSKATPRSNPTIPESFYEEGYTYRIARGYVIKYGIETMCEDMNPDPMIETVRVWVVEEDGYVQQINSIAKLRRDSSISRQYSRKADGVRCIIQWNHNNQKDGNHFTSTQPTILHVDTIVADDYTPKSYTSGGFTVTAGDIITFRLCSNENSSFDDVDWDISILYYDSHGFKRSNAAENYICNGSRTFVAPLNGEAIIRYKAENNYYPPIYLSFYGSDKSAVTIPYQSSTNGMYVPFDTIILVQGDTIKPIVNSASNPNVQWNKVHIHPEIEYHWSHWDNNNTNIVHDTTFFYPDVDYPCSVISADSIYTFLFGKLYRGWGRFAYHPQSNSDTLDLCSLYNTERTGAQMAQQNQSTWENLSLPIDTNSILALGTNGVDSIFSVYHFFNPLADSSTWIPLNADSRTERWIPYGNIGYISATGQSNSRNIESTPEKDRGCQQVTAQMNDTIEDVPLYDSAIPSGSIASTRKAPLKSIKSINHAISGGLLGVPMSLSVSWGTYNVLTDFIDLNGDGFPDAVGSSGVQYSLPWGGLGALVDAKLDGHENHNFAVGMNFSRSATIMKKEASNSVTKTSYTIEGSGGLSDNEGIAETDRTFIDINGDGLPDIVSKTDTTVRYNLGYRFLRPIKISCNDFIIQHSSSQSAGASTSVAFSIEQYSLGGGLDGSLSNNLDDVQFIDINGDGLPDMVRRVLNQLEVAYNLGTRFASTFASLNIASDLRFSHSWNLEGCASGTMGVTFMGMAKACFGLQGGGGGGESCTDVSFIDMNGDGCPDHVFMQNNTLYVHYNQTSGTNLLSDIINPTGQHIELNYSLSHPSQEHRQRQWNLTQISDGDGTNPWLARQNVITTKEYDSTYYDNHERTDYGYARIMTNESNIRLTEERYNTCAFILRNRKSQDVVMNHDSARYIRHRYMYGFRDFKGFAENNICNDFLFANEDTICTDYYEGESSPQITTRVRMRYDDAHNVKEYYDDGDIIFNGDDWKRRVTYMPTTYMNLVSLPIADSVLTPSDHLLRLRYATWLNTGRLNQMKIVDPHTGVEAMTSLFYDNYGNIAQYFLPVNDNGERAHYTIQYENDLHALPKKIDNHFGEQKSIFYNPRWGLPVRTIDPGGAEITYTYDYMGRLTHVLAPKEREIAIQDGWSPEGSNVPYTVRYTYNNIRHNLADLTHDTLTHTYVLKQMATCYEHTTIDEAAIYSARGEMLQKKKRAEVLGNIIYLTDGIHLHDSLGRVYKAEYPSVSNTALWLYDGNSNSTGGTVAMKRYDVLDRDTLTLFPDGEELRKRYLFERDCDNVLRFAEQIIDPLGNTTAKLSTSQGWTVQTKAADNSTTCYTYNSIGEMEQVVDADNYITLYSYNGFGQMQTRKHPDAGSTIWRYDAAGNLVCSQTQKQEDINDSTTYRYYYDRLLEISHTQHPWENVMLYYDAAGRLALREDRTGSERLWYDELGNVRRSLKRIITPSDNVAFQFQTDYVFDSFGRIRQMRYPDGEYVYYNYYNTTGNLSSVFGSEIGVGNIFHDELGHVTDKRYDNGCYTEYKYDSDRQWLTRILSASYNDGNTFFQDLQYKYDPVGNITQTNQQESTWYGMGVHILMNIFTIIVIVWHKICMGMDIQVIQITE